MLTAASCPFTRPGWMQRFPTQCCNRRSSPYNRQSHWKNEEEVSVSILTKGGVPPLKLCHSHALPNMKHLLSHAFFVPREFTYLMLIAVYIPPEAGAMTASKQLSAYIMEIENSHRVISCGTKRFHHVGLKKELQRIEHIFIREDEVTYCASKTAVRPLAPVWYHPLPWNTLKYPGILCVSTLSCFNWDFNLSFDQQKVPLCFKEQVAG